jgi:hypothetical protein
MGAAGAIQWPWSARATAARRRSPPCRSHGFRTASTLADRANREPRSRRRTARRPSQGRARPGDHTPCTTRLAPHDQPHASCSRVAQRHGRPRGRLLSSLSARRVVSAWLSLAVVHIVSAGGAPEGSKREVGQWGSPKPAADNAGQSVGDQRSAAARLHLPMHGMPAPDRQRPARSSPTQADRQ